MSFLEALNLSFNKLLKSFQDEKICSYHFLPKPLELQ